MTVVIRLRLSHLDEDMERLRAMVREAGSDVWLKSMRQIGVLVCSQAKRAFKDQRLGSDIWPERYPNQEQEKVNVAGIVSDLTRGQNPPKRRFEARPALRDTGNLLRSLEPSRAVTTSDFAVAVESREKHAAIHQTGGTSRQAITDPVKKALGRFLKRRKDLRSVLGWLFSRDYLETKINKRPFVGITDPLKDKIVRTVERNLGEEWRQGLPAAS